MPDFPNANDVRSGSRVVRDIADRYVSALAQLDPILATRLGIGQNQDQLPDLSPAGQEAIDALARSTLAELAGVNAGADADDRRCGRLLAERLEAKLAMSEQREHLRAVSNLFGPPQQVRSVFLDMPSATEDDWAMIASRMSKVPAALAGYRARLDDAAASAIAAVADLRDWLASDYLPVAAEHADGVGSERYLTCARNWTGANLDAAEAYSWGWSQFNEIREQMRQEADRILSGATVRAAMEHLDAHGEAVEGVDAIRTRLQQMMDSAIAELDGTMFDIADPVKVVEARI